MSKSTRKLVFAALLLAIGMVLPFLTGQIPEIGSRLSPMHIPVLLCGWKWGLLVGAILPLLRSVTFGMPPLMPTAAAMAFELAAYGAVSALLWKKCNVYLSLIGAMLIGRVVWGAASLLFYALVGKAFSWEIFAAGAFLNALPGIALHILLIPPIVLALKKAGFAEK